MQEAETGDIKSKYIYTRKKDKGLKSTTCKYVL